MKLGSELIWFLQAFYQLSAKSTAGHDRPLMQHSDQCKNPSNVFLKTQVSIAWYKVVSNFTFRHIRNFFFFSLMKIHALMFQSFQRNSCQGWSLQMYTVSMTPLSPLPKLISGSLLYLKHISWDNQFNVLCRCTAKIKTDRARQPEGYLMSFLMSHFKLHLILQIQFFHIWSFS